MEKENKIRANLYLEDEDCNDFWAEHKNSILRTIKKYDTLLRGKNWGYCLRSDLASTDDYLHECFIDLKVVANENGLVIYEKCEKIFDYEDMKIAIVLQEFIDNNKIDVEKYKLADYEDLVLLAAKIHSKWLLEKEYGNLSKEEKAYIQVYAYKYLEEKFKEE